MSRVEHTDAHFCQPGLGSGGLATHQNNGSHLRQKLKQASDLVDPLVDLRGCYLRVPFQPGTTFHNNVFLRGISAARMKLNVASAVGSSLSLLINPEPIRPVFELEVIGPGFSNRNSNLAAMPPSIGSKSGTSKSPPIRKDRVYSLSGVM